MHCPFWQHMDFFKKTAEISAVFLNFSVKMYYNIARREEAPLVISPEARRTVRRLQSIPDTYFYFIHKEAEK